MTSTAPGGVLVTGASTPLGMALCHRLLRTPGVTHVLAVALEKREDLPALPMADERLHYHQVDLSRLREAHELLFRVARDLQVGVVLHLAMHRLAKDRGRRVHALNVEAFRQLMDLAERHPTIRRLVLRSYGEVYRVQHDLPCLVTEDHPLNLAPTAPQWIRDRVEADLTACARMGLSRLQIAVLRFAEVLAPDSGSQLHDYLSAPICFRPMGFDPMINVLSNEDGTEALIRAMLADGVQGVFNIPGADTLPLSLCIRKWNRPAVPIPEQLIPALYRLRRRIRGADFSYGMNQRRFHYVSVLDGTRARETLGYSPANGVDWPGDTGHAGPRGTPEA